MLGTRFLKAAAAAQAGSGSILSAGLAAKPIEPAFVHLPLTSWPISIPPASTSTTPTEASSTEASTSSLTSNNNNNSQLYVPLPSYLFHSPPRPDILHQCVVSHLASLRQGTARTKNRAEVKGSNRKLRPQKGSGSARVGDARSPIRRGGGRAFPKRQKDWSLGLNSKVWQLGIRTALSERWRRGELSIIPSPPVLEDISTRSLTNAISSTFSDPQSSSTSSSSSSKTLFLLSSLDPKFALSARNIPSVTVDLVDDIDVFPLLQGDRVVLDIEAVQQLEDWLGRSEGGSLAEEQGETGNLSSFGFNGPSRIPPGEESTTQEELSEDQQQQERKPNTDKEHGDAIREEMEQLKQQEGDTVDASEDRPSAKDVL